MGVYSFGAHIKSLINCCNYKNPIQGSCIGRNTNLWKLRNDSSEINAVLNPDFCGNSKYTIMSVPNMTFSGKLILTSKKRAQFAPKKPVKECYCNYEVNKMHKKSRTQHTPVSSCRHCRSQLELKSIRETNDKTALTSPISCETFRRIKKIDYTPRSQFLRNVQNKICELQTGGQGDCLRICPRSSSYHRFITSPKMQDIIPENEKSTLPNEHKHVDKRQSICNQGVSTSLGAPVNSLANERSKSNDVACTLSKGIQVSSRKLSKSILRKTIKSKRQIPKSSERLTSKSPTRNKRAQLRKQDCPCCCRNESRTARNECVRTYNLPEYCEQRDQCLKHDDSIIDDSIDQEVEDLRKFREQNYFETHGSNHTLASSRSSRTLQQYVLNERLFSEPVGKIHKQDLVVTIPPCATVQKKRVHYFPRYVVRQEKNVCNSNYRRKRCQSCPLTGHAIDLGVLKARPPLNSLALKYQKRIP